MSVDSHASVVVAYLRTVGEVLHRTQRERGASSIYLASGGRLFGDELRLTRLATDHARDQLEGQATNTGSDGEIPTEMSGVVDRLSGLQVLRRRIDERTIEPQEAVEALTDLNQSALAGAGELVQQVVDTSIRSDMVALLALLRSKELLGIERAVGAQIFTEGRFRDGNQLWMIALMSAQESLLRIVDRLADEELLADMALLAAHPAVLETGRMETSALVNGSHAFDIDPEHWLTAMTQRIDAMKSIEDERVEHLRSLVARTDDRDRQEDPVVSEALTATIEAMREIRSLVDAVHAGGNSIRELVRGRDDALSTATRQLAVAQRTAEELAQQATHDHLTGLPNRAIIDDVVGGALDRSRLTSTTVAVITLDLDHFKLVNDSMGHAAGDELLQSVAQRLRGSVRGSDTVVRFGGDEFVIIAEPVADTETAMSIADRLLGILSAPHSVAGRTLTLTASIGVAVADRSYDCAAELLRDSDIAAYRAKALGRSRVELFDRELRAEVVERLETEQALRRALEHDDLVAHFQPIIDLATGEPIAMESLARWRAPHGVVSAGQFFAIAGEAGLLPAIDDAVVRHALRHRPTYDGKMPKLSINMSDHGLRQPAYADYLLGRMAEVEVAPSDIWVEITEHAALGGDVAIRNLHELREHGFTIALDDFGSGFSAMSVLRTLPIDLVKLDGLFVKDLAVDESTRVIIESILRIVDTLGLRAVAEGVESAEQLHILAEMGCHMAQGFFVSRPSPDASSWRLPGRREIALT